MHKNVSCFQYTGFSVVLADFQCELNGKLATSTETPCIINIMYGSLNLATVPNTGFYTPKSDVVRNKSLILLKYTLPRQYITISFVTIHAFFIFVCITWNSTFYQLKNGYLFLVDDSQMRKNQEQLQKTKISLRCSRVTSALSKIVV